MLNYFTGSEVVNFSSAGGGASTSLQMAGIEGVFKDAKYDHLVWEVATDFDEPKLVGSALAAMSYMHSQCYVEAQQKHQEDLTSHSASGQNLLLCKIFRPQ